MQNIPGVEKIIFKAVAGSAFDTDVEISGNDLSTDTQAELQQIMTATAKGGMRHQGNRSFEFDMQCFDVDKHTDLEDHRNLFGELEIYELGEDAVPTLTLTNVNPRLDEIVNFDPSSEDSASFTIGIQGVNKLS